MATVSQTQTVVAEEAPKDERVKHREEAGRYLPPIYRIKMPTTITQSAKIRWLFALGYPVKEIAKGLGIRYQQIRNIVTTEPKRAAREDLPVLTIELVEMEDIADVLLGQAMEEDFLKARKDTVRNQKKARRALPAATEEEEVDEITELEDD